MKENNYNWRAITTMIAGAVNVVVTFSWSFVSAGMLVGNASISYKLQTGVIMALLTIIGYVFMSIVPSGIIAAIANIIVAVVLLVSLRSSGGTINFVSVIMVAMPFLAMSFLFPYLLFLSENLD